MAGLFDKDLHVPLIAGLTGSGKSALALRLAEELDGEIINADAMQVYTGFDIGTAKPTKAEQALINHHLIDICDATERYSVAQYVDDAVLAIQDVLDKGRLPIVCGGSGQYTTALLSGTRFWPLEIDASIRAEVDDMIANMGYSYLLQQIEKLDPATWLKLSVNDKKRIQRFFLVFNATGMTRTEMNEWSNQGKPAFHYRPICLAPCQDSLAAPLAARTRRMYASGLVEEARQLCVQSGNRSLVPCKGIGYRHTVAYLVGELDLNKTIELTIRDTMRLAKRQRTWYRHHAHGPFYSDGKAMTTFNDIRSYFS